MHMKLNLKLQAANCRMSEGQSTFDKILKKDRGDETLHAFRQVVTW